VLNSKSSGAAALVSAHDISETELELHRQLARLRTDLESALPQVVPALHAELRQLAAAQRRRFAAPATLSTTAVVNELYLKFAQSKGITVESRRHFFALAAMAMRQILIDHARARLRAAQESEPGWLPAEVQPQDLIEMDRLLADLALAHPRLAQVVTCRYFAGYSEVETAEVLGVTDRTVRRDWDKARAWLGAALS
jgi:RNA polymerase sigma factor (TIGR02999 family)